MNWSPSLPRRGPPTRPPPPSRAPAGWPRRGASRPRSCTRRSSASSPSPPAVAPTEVLIRHGFRKPPAQPDRGDAAGKAGAVVGFHENGAERALAAGDRQALPPALFHDTPDPPGLVPADPGIIVHANRPAER